MSPIARISVDLTTHTPAYLQIISQIKQAIASGELKPGDQLPTVRQLAADLQINFNTVARAYRMLDEKGIISTQHGRGTFILDAPTGKELERFRKQQLVVLGEHYIEEAERLGFEPSEVRTLIEGKIAKWERKQAERKNT